MKTRVDIRMLRDGTRWCGVATITSPCLRAPLDLYAEGDARDLYNVVSRHVPSVGRSMETRKKAASRISSSTRNAVRHRVLGLAHGYLSQESDIPDHVRAHVKGALEATDRACDLVQKSRAGDHGPTRAIATIFSRAKNGDIRAVQSSKLIAEARDLVDDGRCSIVVKQVPRQAVGHEIATLRRQLPGKVAGLDGYDRVTKERIARVTRALFVPTDYAESYAYPMDKFDLTRPYGRGEDLGLDRSPVDRISAAARSLFVPTDYDDSIAYPMDNRGSDLLQNFQPPVAEF